MRAPLFEWQHRRLFETAPYSAGWSSLVARRAHNPEVVGSNPAPATMKPQVGSEFASDLFRVSSPLGYQVVPKWSRTLLHLPTQGSFVRLTVAAPLLKTSKESTSPTRQHSPWAKDGALILRNEAVGICRRPLLETWSSMPFGGRGCRRHDSSTNNRGEACLSRLERILQRAE